MKLQSILKGSQWISLLMMAVTIIVIIVAVRSFDGKSNRLGVETLENTIEQYAVACYATEGSYPPDLAYLEDHYGLILDESLYIYEYEIFGSNVMPIVTVIERP